MNARVESAVLAQLGGVREVAVECARGTRVTVVLSEDFDPYDNGALTRDDAVRIVDDWSARRSCPCCGGCLTLAAVSKPGSAS